MAIIQRQAFLMKLLTDEALCKSFFSDTTCNYGLSKQDAHLLRQLDPEGLLRKNKMLARKQGKEISES
tara:strand:- start:761 stop:964 length:204 start_codon:yes stop_codon:yes gene_type:complete